MFFLRARKGRRNSLKNEDNCGYFEILIVVTLLVNDDIFSAIGLKTPF